MVQRYGDTGSVVGHAIEPTVRLVRSEPPSPARYVPIRTRGRREPTIYEAMSRARQGTPEGVEALLRHAHGLIERAGVDVVVNYRLDYDDQRVLAVVTTVELQALRVDL